MTTVRAVLFDIDGTLLTTGGAGARAWQLAFEDLYGVSANIADHTESGMVDHAVARATFVAVVGREPTRVEVDALFEAYLVHLRETVAESRSFHVLPGVHGLLYRLHREGVLLGLTSGNVKTAAFIKLGRARIGRHFSVGGFGSDSTSRVILTRTAIERSARLLGAPFRAGEVVVVGDTPRDVRAAKASGAVAVAVATGGFTAGELADAGADHVVDSLADGLPELGPDGAAAVL